MSTEKKVVRIKLPNLRRAREARKLSQAELAQQAGVTTYQVCVAELGRAVQPTVGEKLAKTMTVKLQSLRS